MTNGFLPSSPSKQEQLSKSGSPRQSVKTPASNKVSSTIITSIKTSTTLPNSASKNKSLKQQPPPPPSASKFINQCTNLTGWTPLISKTYSNEQILSFNSTPNKFIISNNQSQLQVSASGVNDSNIDFQSFGLTPFINHNVNSNSQLNSVTPFHEKIFQHHFNNICDFYIDSPIKNNINSTVKNDLQTITPSKFNLSNVANKKILQDPLKSATKRSIALVDTPPRQPHKLSITTKNEEKSDDDDDDDEKENLTEEEKLNQTPCKIKPLKDITNRTKPVKLEFETPAKQKLHAPSSPSTIIVSSPVKHSCMKDKSINNTKDKSQPQSPTPAKSKINPPIMGVFTENKNSEKQPSMNHNPNIAKNKPKKKISTNLKPITNTIETVDVGKHRAQNKAKMQAGMNKFQIVFTDVHNLMNKKKPKKIEEKKTIPPRSSSSSSLNHSSSQPPQLSHQTSNLHDSSINTSKDHSSIISSGNLNNSSMNSSHFNMEHSSFEINGLSSTPNSKFLLDKVSPNQSQLQANQPYYIPNTMPMAPPSKTKQPLPQSQQISYIPQPYPFLSMTMSTPQHHGITNYTNTTFNDPQDISYNFGTPMSNSIFNNIQYSKEFDDSIE